MKKYVKSTVIITVLVLLAVAIVIVEVDPLYQYHLPKYGFNTVIAGDEQYAVPGIAKNFEYTSAIIGTSMSENLRTSWFDEKMGGKTVKLTISGSRSKDYETVLDLALAHSGTENIIMDIGYSYLTYPAGYEAWDDTPDYLYDGNLINDVSYFLNKTVLFKYVPGVVSGNNPDTDMSTLFSWDLYTEFSEENVANIVDYMKNSATNCEIKKEALAANAKENVDILREYIENNKDVDFKIYFPPYSIGFWYVEKEGGKLDIWKEQINYLFSLCEYENVEMFFFSGEDWYGLVSNLNNYKDPIHYNLDMSKKTADGITQKINMVTSDNYEAVISDFFEYVDNFDYSVYLQ